jgi:cell division protein FtsB
MAEPEPPDRADGDEPEQRPGDEAPRRGRRSRRGAGPPGARTGRRTGARSRRTGAPPPGERGRRVQRRPSTVHRHPASALGLSTTRRAAMLAIVVCALILSVAVPLRTYLGQRAEVEIQEQQQAELRAQVERLEQRRAQLNDPAQVEAEARRRLRYVRPGETPYVVELPGDHAGQDAGQPAPPAQRQLSWFETLWGTVTGAGR